MSHFDHCWSKAKKTIFRLEALPVYQIPEEEESFEKWKQGIEYFSPADLDWLNLLETTKKKGVDICRVRVTDLPFSEYLCYENDFWDHAEEKGERFLFMTREEFDKIKEQLSIEPNDFWLFDEKELLIFNYGKQGDWIGDELVNETERVNKYAALKQLLLARAIPRKDFLRTRKAPTRNRGLRRAS